MFETSLLVLSEAPVGSCGNVDCNPWCDCLMERSRGSLVRLMKMSVDGLSRVKVGKAKDQRLGRELAFAVIRALG